MVEQEGTIPAIRHLIENKLVVSRDECAEVVGAREAVIGLTIMSKVGEVAGGAQGKSIYSEDLLLRSSFVTETYQLNHGILLMDRAAKFGRETATRIRNYIGLTAVSGSSAIVSGVEASGRVGTVTSLAFAAGALYGVAGAFKNHGIRRRLKEGYPYAFKRLPQHD